MYIHIYIYIYIYITLYKWGAYSHYISGEPVDLLSAAGGGAPDLASMNIYIYIYIYIYM